MFPKSIFRGTQQSRWCQCFTHQFVLPLGCMWLFVKIFGFVEEGSNYFWNPRFLTWLWIIKNNTYRKNVVGFTCPDYQVVLECKQGYRKKPWLSPGRVNFRPQYSSKNCIYQSIVNLSLDKRKYTEEALWRLTRLSSNNVVGYATELMPSSTQRSIPSPKILNKCTEQSSIAPCFSNPDSYVSGI